jgi:hypothetical protein
MILYKNSIQPRIISANSMGLKITAFAMPSGSAFVTIPMSAAPFLLDLSRCESGTSECLADGYE